jgi:hypothetical protein
MGDTDAAGSVSRDYHNPFLAARAGLTYGAIDLPDVVACAGDLGARELPGCAQSDAADAAR